MKKLILLCGLFTLPVLAAAATPSAVATFESLGLYWAPGGAADECQVSYRPKGTTAWKQGLSLWYDDRNAEYRGSLVHLTPGTTYEVMLKLVNTGTTNTFEATTWSEKFPVANVVELPPSSSSPLVITQGGTASGYVLYTGASGGAATIDVNGAVNDIIQVKAPYVIIRGLTLKNAARHGIRLFAGAHDVVIEKNDISGWGRVAADGWGENNDSAIYADSAPDLARIVIERNKMHHPRSDSNNWSEQRSVSVADPFHPVGPLAVCFFNSAGNHVIRYNEIYSDNDHYFEDALGGGSNFSVAGFPNRDSDIYGNHIQHVWDDGIESEGANRNVRIWGNFTEWTHNHIATASTATGPLYVWRNLSGVTRHDEAAWDENLRGRFLKTEDETPSGGKLFVFHNTILQPPPPSGSTYPIGAHRGMGDYMSNLMTRNNILHVHKDTGVSIEDGHDDPQGDYDYDLYNGLVEPLSEPHGIPFTSAAPPIYAPSLTYSPVNGSGTFHLASNSIGYDQGERINNFNDGFTGAGPDMGAHEAGTPRMKFGVNAHYPDTTPPLVAITAPAAPAPNNVSGTISVLADASDTDDSGQPADVAGVQFTLDGNNLGTEDTEAPYAISWDTTQTANGVHTLSATARDASGNFASSTVMVTVNNTSALTLTFTPIADATIKAGSRTTNYGTSSTLELDKSPLKHFLMKFVVEGITAGQHVKGAKLRLFNVNASNKGGTFHRIGNSNWTETGVTWKNAPASDSAKIASLGVLSANTWYEVNLTSLITRNGTYSLRVKPTSDNDAVYSSKEAAGSAPQLVVDIGT